MKKNLLGILILGLTFVNIIISGITMFTVMTTNQKTAKVVSDVANAISIDMGTGSSEGEVAQAVPIEDIETYSIPGATVGEKENLFRSIVNDVISKYTIDEARVSQDEIKKEILSKVQEKYSDSDFIFDVSFSDIVFQ